MVTQSWIAVLTTLYWELISTMSEIVGGNEGNRQSWPSKERKYFKLTPITGNIPVSPWHSPRRYGGIAPVFPLELPPRETGGIIRDPQQPPTGGQGPDRDIVRHLDAAQTFNQLGGVFHAFLSPRPISFGGGFGWIKKGFEKIYG